MPKEAEPLLPGAATSDAKRTMSMNMVRDLVRGLLEMRGLGNAYDFTIEVDAGAEVMVVRRKNKREVYARVRRSNRGSGYAISLLTDVVSCNFTTTIATVLCGLLHGGS